MLTIQIVTLTCNSQLHDTIKSLLPLNANITVVCKEQCNLQPHGVTQIKSKHWENRSQLRNELLDQLDGWFMYVNPGEVLANGVETILEVVKKEPNTYRLPVYQGDTVVKETRLWHTSKKIKFTNPIYESVKADSVDLGAILYIADKPSEDTTAILNKWKLDEPMALEPYYYEAFNYLQQKKYPDFLRAAENYLKQNSSGKSAIMLRYYTGMVKLYVFGEVKSSAKDVLMCLTARPEMSEFWCLLGDIYYNQKVFAKARSFYENAIILANHRRNDDWPTDLNKCGDHPKKMILLCEKTGQSFFVTKE